MKKGFMLGLMFFGMLGICSQASAENIFAGKVAASNTSVISAPYGGRVDNIYVHVGDYVGEDSLIATLGTDEVYALVDGTVSGIFASEGDDAESVAERYGAVLFIEPTNRFTLDCSNEKGYSYSENRYIHIGETVYLSCTTDGSHSGVGVVTGVDEKDEKKFSVEVTEGLFYMNESVGVFRNPQYTSMSRIGRGTVVRTAAVAAKAKGTTGGKLLKRHILKNTLLPIITLLGMNLASIVCGSFIIESVFGWPGIGTLAMTAIGVRDYPVIMAYVMLSGIILVVGNFIADILYAFADPRIKREDMAND